MRRRPAEAVPSSEVPCWLSVQGLLKALLAVSVLPVHASWCGGCGVVQGLGYFLQHW
jgi:hypothetical protein